MLSWVTILVSIDTPNEEPQADVESILEAGAIAQGYSYEEIEISEGSGAEFACKLIKQ